MKALSVMILCLLLGKTAAGYDSMPSEYATADFDLKSYLFTALYSGINMLLAGVLPLIVTALVMQQYSNLLRRQLAGVLGIKGYIYLTAPGVMVHELSHALFCIIFRHKILKMKLFSPEADGTLGYVNHSYNPARLYQRIGNFFIGTGPVWGGCAVLWLISYWLLPEFMLHGYGIAESFHSFIDGVFTLGFWLRWQSWLWLYLALTVASHITLSPPDLKGAADGLWVIVVVVMLANLLLGWTGSWAEYIWQCEVVMLTKLLIAVMGTLIAGAAVIITLLFCKKR